MIKARPSPIAGTWYPGSPDALARSVDQQLQQAHVETPSGELVALIVPHAGHRYSGQVAALAFRLLQGARPAVVAIVSPMHHPYASPLLTTAHPAYQTPLGTIPVDEAAVARVEALLPSEFRPEHILNDPEHSLEIELPFLQRALSSPFRLVPFMLRDQSRAIAEVLGGALAAALAGQSALLVASSDLSHFFPDPLARRLDANLLSHIEAFDPAGVLEAEAKQEGFACGHGAIAAVLWAARGLGANSAHILGYANSGDVTGDLTSVVGYGAAAITRQPAA